MHLLGVVVGSLALILAVHNEPAQQNRELLEAMQKTVEAVAKLMDLDTYKAFSLVQKRIVSAVKIAKIDNKQFSAAMDLVRFISRRIEDGTIHLTHIKNFIAFCRSGKLNKLLSTWDKDLLFKKP